MMHQWDNEQLSFPFRIAWADCSLLISISPVYPHAAPFRFIPIFPVEDYFMRKIFPVFAVVMGLFWVVMAFDYRLWVRRGPGGGFFPLIGGALAVIFSLLYLYGEFKKPTAAEINVKFLYPILAVLGVLIGSYVIGLIPCMLLYIFLWLWRYEKYPLSTCIYVSAGTIVALYLVFVTWLSVPLPVGWLGQAVDNLIHPDAFKQL